MLNHGEQEQEAQELSSFPGHEKALRGMSGQLGEAWTFSQRLHSLDSHDLGVQHFRAEVDQSVPPPGLY